MYALGGNISGQRYTATVDPASVAANTSGETNIAVAGLPAGLAVLAVKDAGDLDAGLGVWAYTTAGNIVLRLINATAGPIDVASGTWTFIVLTDTGEEVAL